MANVYLAFRSGFTECLFNASLIQSNMVETMNEYKRTLLHKASR